MKNLLLPTLFSFLLFLSACSGGGVNVTAFSPTGEVEEYTTFEVEFSEALAPDGKVGEWVDGDLIEFEPAISGKYKWDSPNTLLFSPDQPLKPGQDYTARVTDKVLEGTDKKGDFDAVNFHTEYFDATRVEFFWTQIPHSEFKVSVRANLYFNYEVDPKIIGDFLEVEKEGQRIKNFNVVSTEPDKVIAVDFGEVQQTEKFQEFKIAIGSGLTSIASERPMSDTREYDVKLDPLARLAVTNVSSGYSSNKGWIEVFTTQAVDEKDIRKYVKISPNKDYKVMTTANSFRLEAAFTPGTIVNLSIKKGMPGLYGGQMEDAYGQEVVMANLSPKLNFADETGQYLMRGGMENLKVEAVNVKRANVRIYEVFANNLLYYLYSRGGGYYSDNCCGVQNGFVANTDDYEGEYYDDYYYDDYYYGSDVGNYGRLLHSDSVILGDNKNRLEDFTVNLNKFLDSRFGGIYVVEVRDDRDYWRKDLKVVSVSDLGIIAKRSNDELFVMVNSIRTAEPLSGVDIALISTNNQPLITGKTGPDGIVHFKDITGDIKDFVPRMVTARKGEDFNFVDFKSTEVGLSRFEVGGKMEYSAFYDTYIYGDRNLFRPGETAHFNTIVRDKNLATVSDLPVVMKVINPRGRNFLETKKTLNKEGSADLEVELPDYAATGDYSLEVYTGDNQLMSSYKFSVEEFVPDKIRVEAESKQAALESGEELNIDIFSEYLFGAPCTDHAYEVDVRLRHKSFNSKQFPSYNFHPRKVSNEYLSNDFGEGTLDAEGKDNYSWTAPEGVEASGIIKGTAYVTVFDATGRTVTRNVGFDYLPNDYFVGIKSNSWYVGIGDAVPISAVAVSSRDKVLNSFAAEMEVIRYEWRTTLQKNGSGAYKYQSVRKEIQEEKKQITLSGPTNQSFVPKKSGQYEIRIRKRGQERYTSKTFYAYGSSSSTSTSFQVDREGRIEIVADKEKYAPGESAKLLFKTPFSGKMLVTVERDRVMDHQIVEVENNSAEISVPVTGDHLPNVFVSATIYKGHSAESATPFLVGHGYQPLTVEEASNKIDVQIEAPDKIKPRRNQEIIVKTNANENVHVTLAVVDEGILQIKNFKTPDPYAFMYAKRKLSVSSYDLYEFLLDEVASASSSVAGGDEEGGIGKRANPITAKRFKLLSFWSGVRKTNSQGEAKISVPIPQFNGSARIMAVAYTGKRFGSADKKMTITDDVVVLPAIPRFLSPNDSIILPVSLMNTTDKSGKVEVKVTTEGPITVSSGGSQSVNLKGKDNQNVKFGLQVGNEVGKGKITISTSGLDKVTSEVEIAIRPTSPLVVEEDFGRVKAGSNATVQIPSSFLKGTQNTTLSISKFPGIQHAGNLSYLVKYPHGCLEQTTSKLFPQLYFEDLAAAVAPEAFVDGNPVYFVKEGIRKLQSLQLSDGSLAYWPGGSYTNWWGSTFAAHFLVEAKKNGYDVQARTLNRLLAYLSDEASDKDTYTYRSYRNNSVMEQIRVRKEVIYSLYVLALAERADISLMNYYRVRPHLLTNDSKYLLAGAFALNKDWNAFKELMPQAFIAENPVRESGGSFDSPVRANAIVLSVLCDVDPNNKQIPSIVKYLSTVSKRQLYNTQDRAWTFLALGKAASKNAKANIKVDVMVAGKKVGTYDNQDWSMQSKLLNGQKVTLQASGSGEAYYFWNTEGIKKGGSVDVKEEDKNIVARRKYYSRNGNLITDGRVTQGNLIVCEIELKTGLLGVKNLVVSDLIPAGFEIENPRLGTSTSLSWIKSTLYPDHLDVRDDRLLLFTNMRADDTRRYYYMMRAVNAGKFKLAPLGCEAMYDPDFHSYHGAQWVRVEPK